MKNIYFGIYLGLVVQNNDPEKRGRVKVWVPHIAATIYQDWNKDIPNLTDKMFIFPDEETNPDLIKIMGYLKQSLPWAEVAMPIFGGASTGRYNAFLKKGTTSDSNYWSGASMAEGFRPLRKYTGNNRVGDAFTETNAVGNISVNPHAYQYTPSDYSNLARGEFTIPNVGAHVWIMFIEGNPDYPVVMASSFGQDDWQRIYSMNKAAGVAPKDTALPDYPETYENLDTDTDQGLALNHNTKTFRAKHVFNSNKHSLEFIDTDLGEILKMTHFSGSFLEFNNFTTSMFSSNNDQKLVIGDQFATIRKNQAEYIGGNKETIVVGDSITKLGNFDKRSYIGKQILELLRIPHDLKRLFETQRAVPNITNTSKVQLRVGAPGVCPVCQGTALKFLSPCVTCKGAGLSPSTQDGYYMPDPSKWTPLSLPYLWFDDITRQWNIPGPVPPLAPLMWDPVRREWINPNWVNNFNPIDPGSLATHPISWIETHPASDTWSAPLISHSQRLAQRLIMEYEAEFGNGGDDMNHVTGNKVETIGAIFNDLPSFRIDPVGKIRDSRTYIGLFGTYVAMKETPLVEYVDVDNVPGGDYDVTVGNKYTLTVGSKGIRVKTTGPLDIYGTIVNFTGEQINISSNNEVIIDGGERLELRASVINIKPKIESAPELGATNIPRTADQYVMLDGNVGVKGNMTVVGGTHHEGEVFMHHMVAPDFRYQTEIGCAEFPHSHTFHAPPWTLLGDLLPATIQSSLVRIAAQQNNDPIPVPNLYSPGFWVPD